MRFRTTFLFLAVIFLVMICGGQTATAESDVCSSNNVTVLIYHRFEENKYPTTNVTIERFREQMTYLKENNYSILPLDQLLSMLQQKKELPGNAAVITIDDGYRSVYENAWPVLKEFGYPFTVFLYIKATTNNHWNYMTWDMVKEMQAAGVDLQDHGYAHHRMGTPPGDMKEAEYKQWLRADLQKSRKIFTEQLGVAPRVLAVPYGEYNKEITEISRELGYRALLTQDPGNVSIDTDIFQIPREPILGNDWSTINHFKTILNRRDLPFTDMQPGPGRVGENPPTTFSVRLKNPQCYKKDSLGIYVSELGWIKAGLEGDTLTARNDRSLHRRLNRVAVKGKDTSGNASIRFWQLVQQEKLAEQSTK